MNYPGSKNGAGVYQQIINLLPPHRVYIEPFFGSGAVMRAKLPAEVNIAVDLDSETLEQAQTEIAALAAGSDCAAAQLSLAAEYSCADGIDFLRSCCWQGGELVYCDPPYLFETRSSRRPIYRFEFTKEQHIELLKVIRSLPCYVLISGYYSRLYADYLQGWRTHTFETIKRSGQKGIEWVWMNYPEPLELHDYRYLGKNRTERQGIKRQRERWKTKLVTMPAQKRAALLSAIAELRSTM